MAALARGRLESIGVWRRFVSASEALLAFGRAGDVAGMALFDPKPRAPGSWQRIGGASPPRGWFSQPPRPRVMHEVLFARAAVKRSQGRPRAGYRAAKRV